MVIGDSYGILFSGHNGGLSNWGRASDGSVHIVVGSVKLLSRRKLLRQINCSWIDSLSSIDVAEAKGDLVLLLLHE